MQNGGTRALTLTVIALSFTLSGFALASDTPEFISVRDQIVAAYQKSIDALDRGDAETALQIDTDDWVSVVPGQPVRSKAEMAVYTRRDIASMKPPPGWKAEWRPDYEHNGTTTGIQLYDLKIEGKAATVLCLVGGTRQETIDGKPHGVWGGSHVRDSWIETSTGWRRRKHEKLTINERMVDGRPAQ